jgi:hypothetical protein
LAHYHSFVWGGSSWFIGGGYLANILIASNDPVRPLVTVQAHLDVTGVPSIGVSVDTLDFGPVFADGSDTLDIEVGNEGTDDLLITSVVADPEEYAVIPIFAAINPYGSDVFSVSFSPTAEGGYPGTLTFTTNDPDDSIFVLPLKGLGVLPPVIVVDPDSLSTELGVGETTTDVITISNTGGSEMEFEIAIDCFAGPIGQYTALSLQGDDDYISTAIGYSNPTVFTLELWFKTTTTSGGRLIGFGNSRTGIDSDYWDRHVYMTDSGHIYFGVAAPTGIGIVRSGQSQNDDEWHHVTATLSGQGMKLYIDSTLVDSDPYATSAENYSGYWKIGYGNLNYWENAPSNYYFQGIVDEIRIWSVERTQAEIKTNMYRELAGNEPGLIGYWRFNEGSGGTAFDQSSNGNDGTLHGGPAWIASTAPISPSWLWVNPRSGVVSAGSSTEVDVLCNATTLLIGEYLANIQIFSNDPATDVVLVPVSLTTVELNIEDEQELPQVFALHQNYPNPFNPVSTIRYDLPEASNVSLIVYDILGREVIRLVDGLTEPGYRQVQWDGRDQYGRAVPSGIYIARLATPEYSESIKMLLLK